MKETFLHSKFLFILLDAQGYYLPKFQEAFDLSEHGISAEEYANSYGEKDYIEDIIFIWSHMKIQKKKELISLVIERINDERDNLTNLEKAAIEIGMELT